MKKCLENVRTNTPLVHNITNYVTVNDVANVLLAIGASPIMSDEPEDVEDITSICNGLNINIGTLNKHSIEAMFLAGKRANECGNVVVLDPVGAGASKLRTDTTIELIDKIKFDVIRGNISEIKTIANGNGTTKGVDADIVDAVTKENLPQMIEFAKNLAGKLDCIIAITGAIDIVANKKKCYVIYNGNKVMSRITGTGCQLSALICAFLSAVLIETKKKVTVYNDEVNLEKFEREIELESIEDMKLKATAAAVCTMGLAGEMGFALLHENEGNSTYRNRIIDSIYNMTGEELERGVKYEVY